MTTEDKETINAADIIVRASCGNGFAVPNDFTPDRQDAFLILALARTVVRFGAIIERYEKQEREYGGKIHYYDDGHQTPCDCDIRGRLRALSAKWRTIQDMGDREDCADELDALLDRGRTPENDVQ
jgi:hypothetical protein